MSLTISPRLFGFALFGFRSGFGHPPSLGGIFLSSPEAKRQKLLLVGQQRTQVSGRARRVTAPPAVLLVRRSDRRDRRRLVARRAPHRSTARSSRARRARRSSAFIASTRRSSTTFSCVRRVEPVGRGRVGPRPRLRLADTGRRRATTPPGSAATPTVPSAKRPSGSSAASTICATVPTEKRTSPPPTSLPRSMSTTPKRRSPARQSRCVSAR